MLSCAPGSRRQSQRRRHRVAEGYVAGSHAIGRGHQSLQRSKVTPAVLGSDGGQHRRVAHLRAHNGGDNEQMNKTRKRTTSWGDSYRRSLEPNEDPYREQIPCGYNGKIIQQTEPRQNTRTWTVKGTETNFALLGQVEGEVTVWLGRTG